MANDFETNHVSEDLAEIPTLWEAMKDPHARFETTALFVDMVDSTAMKLKLGELAWVSQLAWLYATTTEKALAVVPECEYKFLGDGLLFFLSSNDAAAAINIAMAIQEEIQRANRGEAAGAMGTIDLRVRIGIATGKSVKFRTPKGIDFVGSVIDRASRLCSAANASGVFMDKATASDAKMGDVRSVVGRETGRTADEYQGELQNTVGKGFSDPIAYFEILWSTQRFGVNANVNTATTNRLHEVSQSQAAAVAPARPNDNRTERRGGKIKHWNADRKYGFITDLVTGEDFFLSADALVYGEDLTKLTVGRVIAFVVTPQPVTDKCRKATAALLDDEAAEGVVVSLPDGKPHGWIKVVAGADSHLVFVRLSGTMVLRVGDNVSFTVTVNDKGASAADVSIDKEENAA